MGLNKQIKIEDVLAATKTAAKELAEIHVVVARNQQLCDALVACLEALMAANSEMNPGEIEEKDNVSIHRYNSGGADMSLEESPC